MYHCQLTPPPLMVRPSGLLVLIISTNHYGIQNITGPSSSCSNYYSGGVLAGALVVAFVVPVITMVIIN